jgi:eukaryotic-like serine/threonine-protein kinase
MPPRGERTDPMLSRYKILGKLGAGGMGVVYRAEDLTLKRSVALKVITGALQEEEHARTRFLREARTAAGLNHPNVCAIYDFGEVQPGEEEALGGGERLQAGTPFISMELVEGRTLAALLRERRPLRFPELIDIAIQVAGGLAAAHASGVVHRDLKPGNVMVAPAGRVKILDFGLAKPVAALTPDGGGTTTTETIPKELTTEGKIVGTMAYMSPEQARGLPVDSRSDVFSFGTMLYEMATGKHPFAGGNPVSTLGKILEAEPESLENAAPASPPELDQIVRRCIRKRPDDRYNDTRDLVIALDEVRQKTTAGEQSAARRRSAVRRRVLWSAAVAGVVVVALAVTTFTLRLVGQRVEILPPTHRQITFTGTADRAIASPDGQFIAYVEPAASGGEQLMVQDLAGGKPLPILSAWGITPAQWSPDGTQICVSTFTEAGPGPGYVVPRLGGTPRRVPSVTGYAAWSPDGKRIANAWTSSRKIEIVDWATGKQQSIPIEVPFTWLGDIDWSRSGELLAFYTVDEKAGRWTIWTISTGGGQPNRVVNQESQLCSPRFSPDGNSIYYLSEKKGDATTGLWKVRVDSKDGRASGKPAVALSGLDVVWNSVWSPSFSVTHDGTRMFYTRGAIQSNLWMAELDAKADGGIRTTQLTSGTSGDSWPRFSPNGESVAFNRGNNVFVLRFDGSSLEQLTFGGAFNPVWSPDGREIAFVSSEGGAARVFKISARGGDARPFEHTSPGGGLNLAWAPGRRILYQNKGNRNFTSLDPITEQEIHLLKDESLGWIFIPEYSPDGARVALFWNRSDSPIDENGGTPQSLRQQIWVLHLDGSLQQTLGGANLLGNVVALGWSSDGAWVYVVAPKERMDASSDQILHPVIWKAPARGGPAVEVVELPFKETTWGGGDVSRDGRRFVFSVVDSRSDAWIVENFDPDLLRK